MNSMKRVGLVAVLVALAALFAASPVLGGKYVSPYYSITSKLVPPVDAPEPGASGQYTLEVYPGQENGTVSCKRLTPGKQYVVLVLVEWYSWEYDWAWWGISGSGSYVEEYVVTADKRGRLDAQFSVQSGSQHVGGWEGGGSIGTTRQVADLWIENAAGDVVLEEP